MSSTNEPLEQPPVMLSSTGGEKVFVGNTASISFLRFLQKTLEHHMGRSSFTEAQESQWFFQADATEVGSSQFYDNLSIESRKILIRCYLDASSGLLDLHSPEEVFEMLDSHELIMSQGRPSTLRKLSSLEIASLYLMVAIGAQCYGPRKEDVLQATELFSYGRKLALEHMLENPSLDLVRVFLLMAFYMLGACRRNPAFMYLGVASRAADILGLQMSVRYTHLSTSVLRARLRIAKSMRVFDVVCNSILGRASSTPPLRPGPSSYVANDNNTESECIYRALALGATYEISATLETAVTKSSAGELNTEAAENLVLALQKCSRSFPSILRQTDTEGNANRHAVIGNIHVSGVYYFSVILVTRHSLIQHVVPRLVGGQQTSHKSTDPAEKAKVTQLADACIEAATFMAQMCHQVMKSGNLVGNMCIVKAWMFAAGLVLGFSMLVENEKKSLKRRTAFLQSLHVLGELKQLSPQAEQYYTILSSFHVAIKAYKEKQGQGTQEARPTLVDRVFQPDMEMDFDDENDAIATQLPSPELSTPELTFPQWQHEMPVASLSGMMPIDPAFFDENDSIMQMLWDADPSAMGFSAGFAPDPGRGLDTSLQGLDTILD